MGKDTQTQTWKQLFTDFASKTTLHGLRYVIIDSQSMPRKYAIYVYLSVCVHICVSCIYVCISVVV